MRNLVLGMLMITAFLTSLNVFAGCSQEAVDFSTRQLERSLRQQPKFTAGDLTFSEKNKGHYVNGAVLRNSGSTFEIYETTLAGLVTNQASEESEFMVQRCVITLDLDSCFVKDKRCTLI